MACLCVLCVRLNALASSVASSVACRAWCVVVLVSPPVLHPRSSPSSQANPPQHYTASASHINMHRWINMVRTHTAHTLSMMSISACSDARIPCHGKARNIPCTCTCSVQLLLFPRTSVFSWNGMIRLLPTWLERVSRYVISCADALIHAGMYRFNAMYGCVYTWLHVCFVCCFTCIFSHAITRCTSS